MKTLLVCPECGFECGYMTWKGKARVIVFTMKKVDGDIFECQNCLSRFECSLSLKDVYDDIIETDVIVEGKLLK